MQRNQQQTGKSTKKSQGEKRESRGGAGAGSGQPVKPETREMQGGSRQAKGGEGQRSGGKGSTSDQ